jgi:CRP/FNR family transcriptional regulator, cyclic AMP receptor protein
MDIDIEKFLEHSEFFSNLTMENRKALADICISREIKKGTILFREGEAGHSLYFLINGNIELSKSSGQGKNIVIRVMKDGEMFGEVVLFEKSNYPVTATAVRKSLVFLIPRNQFNIVMGNERFRNDFLAGMMKKMRYLAERIKYLSLHDVEDRFRQFLLEQYGKKALIKPSISKKDIAAAIATTPETLSRLLNRLQGEGVLSWKGNQLMIKESFWLAEKD